MALGPIPRPPSGLIGLLALTNEGRFPAQLSEVISPALDYTPFLLEGVGVRWQQATGVDIAPNVVTLQTPSNVFRLAYAVTVTVQATAAIAEWTARLTYGVGGTNAAILNVNFSTLAAGEGQVATLWFPQPLLMPPSSDLTHLATVGAVAGFVTVSLLCAEFPA